jgi:hypothetical protein
MFILKERVRITECRLDIVKGGKGVCEDNDRWYRGGRGGCMMEGMVDA